jgi:L-ascorbate metabolism protein UlaG (beta-lactamase superfamily)
VKLTKFEHACFAVEESGQSLIVDPGDFTSDFVVPDNVAAVVITHEHGDHFDIEKLRTIIDSNPDAIVVAHESIISRLDNFKTQAVAASSGIKIGGFELEFYGGTHARITKDWQPIPNLGVRINSRLYYPGDSFALPDGVPIEVLAVPAAAPWMKISEATEFIESLKPKMVFPTHDALLSAIGKKSVDKWLTLSSNNVGARYTRVIGTIEL